MPTGGPLPSLEPMAENNNNSNNPNNNRTNNQEGPGGLLNGPLSDKVPQKLEAQNQPHRDLDFDDLLPYVGEFGKYQKILFCLMVPFLFFVAWVYFTQIFITLVPEEHWCRVPELQHLEREQRIALSIPPELHGSMSGPAKCLMYDVNYTEVLANGVVVADPDWPQKPCSHGWEFDKSVIPYDTIATELDWVCEKSALPTYAQSIFFVGAIIGGLIFGWMADRSGRIPALVVSNLVGGFGGVLTIFSRNFYEFAFCRFLVGFAFDNCFSMIYILALEYVGPKWRTFVANMSIALFFTTAACALPWIAYYLADWRMTTLAVSLPLFLAILTPWLAPESARWLVSQGRVDEAMKILKKFEKINRRTIPADVYRDFEDTCVRLQKEQEADKTYSVLDLFRSPRLRNITILLIIIWMAISLVFDGHVRNVDNLGLNVFVTFTIASGTELPADTFLTLVLDRWGRRWLACGTMVISGLFSIWAGCVSSKIFAASLAIMGRFCVNISYNIGLQYAAEVLPTVVRGQGVTFIHIMGYVASIVAPFIVYLGFISPALPLLILGILGVLGGMLALFLPETLDQDLPQTLQDGEEFGKDQGLWDMPCLTKKHDDEEIVTKPSVNEIMRRNSTLRCSRRASIRGETLRSSMIQRSSIRSRASIAPAVEEERL